MLAYCEIVREIRKCKRTLTAIFKIFNFRLKKPKIKTLNLGSKSVKGMKPKYFYLQKWIKLDEFLLNIFAFSL